MIDLVLGGISFSVLSVFLVFCLDFGCFPVFDLLLLFWFVRGCWLLLVVVLLLFLLLCWCFVVIVVVCLFVCLFVRLFFFVFVVLFLSLLFLLFVCPRTSQQINK